MSDLIDRKAAIDVIDKIFPVDPMRNDYTQGITCGAALAKEYIKQLPLAEPKRGRWIIVTIGEMPRYRDSPIYEPIYKCSCCGRTTESYVRFEEPIMPEDADFPRYCPNCGALMEVRE